MSDVRERAKEFYQTEIDPNADDPLMYRYMADFASRESAEAVQSERAKIADELEAIVQAYRKNTGVRNLDYESFITKLRGDKDA